MSIAILNNSALTSTHIERLKNLDSVIEYQITIGEVEAIERLKDISIAIADCASIPFSRGLFQSSPSLKYICLNSTGFNQVDIQAAKESGVIISNIPYYSTDSVAEHTIGLILTLARHILTSDLAMRKNPFEIELANKQHYKYLGTTLRGKTLGIIGLGEIGIRVAELGVALGMNVIAATQYEKIIVGVSVVEFEKLLIESDFISINAAYDFGYKNVLDKIALSKIKPSAIIVNTSRAGFIDEKEIAIAIKSKKLSGYGSDVISDSSIDNPLLNLENVVLTPHLGFFSEKSLQILADTILMNVECYLNGNPINTIK